MIGSCRNNVVGPVAKGDVSCSGAEVGLECKRAPRVSNIAAKAHLVAMIAKATKTREEEGARVLVGAEGICSAHLVRQDGRVVFTTRASALSATLPKSVCVSMCVCEYVYV